MINFVTFSLLVCTFVILVGYYFTGKGNKRRNLRRPPGPKGIPFLGNILAVSGSPHISYSKWQKKHGNLFMLTFGPIEVLVLGTPALIKEAFQSPVFNGRPIELSVSLMTGGRNGILTNEGPDWERQRKFTFKHLRSFGFGTKIMETYIMEEVEIFVDNLKSQALGGTPVDMNEKFEMAVASILWKIIASSRFKHDDHEKLTLFRDLTLTFGRPTVAAIVNLLCPKLFDIAPTLTGYNSTMNVVSDIHKMIMHEVEFHEKTLPETPEEARDFIDAYIFQIRETHDPDSSFYKEAGLQSLRAIIDEFFFGATETMILTLSWAILYLAATPRVQKKFQSDIDLVIGSRQRVALTDRPNLPYIEATILEIIRMSSIVVVGVMHSAMEDTQFHGYDIKKGTWVMPNIYAIQHSQELWGDPESFRPERFLSADGKTFLRSENIVSFGLGKRSCVGEHLGKDELFLFLTNIFKRFSISLDPKRSTSLEPQPGFMLRPQDYSIIVKDR